MFWSSLAVKKSKHELQLLLAKKAAVEELNSELLQRLKVADGYDESFGQLPGEARAHFTMELVGRNRREVERIDVLIAERCATVKANRMFGWFCSATDTSAVALATTSSTTRGHSAQDKRCELTSATYEGRSFSTASNSVYSKRTNSDWIDDSTSSSAIDVAVSSDSVFAQTSERASSTAAQERTAVSDVRLSYEELSIRSACPPGVDGQRREDALSDEDFARLFKMSRASFAALPQWRRDKTKRELSLF